MPNPTTTDQSAFLQQIMEKLGHRPESNNIVVRYAGTLTTQMRADIEVHLKMKFPQAQEIVFEEDDELVAGIKIVYKDYVYDDSVSSRFIGLKNTL